MFRGLFCTESESLRGFPVVGSRFSSSNVSLLTNSLIPSSKRRSTGLVTSTLLSNTGSTTRDDWSIQNERARRCRELASAFRVLGAFLRAFSLGCAKPAKCPYKEASYKPFVRCRNACGLRNALAAPFNSIEHSGCALVFYLTEPLVRHVNHAPIVQL